MLDSQLSETSESSHYIELPTTRFSRLSLQLQNLHLLEKGSILLLAIPFLINNIPFSLFFPILVLHTPNTILSLLSFTLAQMFGSLISDKIIKRLYKLNRGLILASLFVILFEISAILSIFQNIVEDWNLVILLIGCFCGGLGNSLLSLAQFMYFSAGFNFYKQEEFIVFFEKFRSFSALLGFLLFFIGDFFGFYLLGFQVISLGIFLFVKDPDLIFKQYLNSLHQQYKLKDVIVRKDEKILASLQLIPEDNQEIEEEGEIEMTMLLENHTKARKRSSFTDLTKKIGKKEGKTLATLAILEATIWSFYQYCFPVILKKIMNISERNLEFKILYIIFGLSRISTLYISKNIILRKRFSHLCNEILKAFSFLIIVFFIGFLLNSIIILAFGLMFLGYCHWLTLIAWNMHVYCDFQQVTDNYCSGNIINGVSKTFILLVAWIIIDENPLFFIGIYIGMIFAIWKINLNNE